MKTATAIVEAWAKNLQDIVVRTESTLYNKLPERLLRSLQALDTTKLA
jgi:hypothetical protein